MSYMWSGIFHPLAVLLFGLLLTVFFPNFQSFLLVHPNQRNNCQLRNLRCPALSSRRIDCLYQNLVASDNTPFCYPQPQAEIVNKFPCVLNSQFLRLFKAQIIYRYIRPAAFWWEGISVNFSTRLPAPGSDRPLPLLPLLSLCSKRIENIKETVQKCQ